MLDRDDCNKVEHNEYKSSNYNAGKAWTSVTNYQHSSSFSSCSDRHWKSLWCMAKSVSRTEKPAVCECLVEWPLVSVSVSAHSLLRTLNLLEIASDDLRERRVSRSRLTWCPNGLVNASSLRHWPVSGEALGGDHVIARPLDVGSSLATSRSYFTTPCVTITLYTTGLLLSCPCTCFTTEHAVPDTYLKSTRLYIMVWLMQLYYFLPFSRQQFFLLGH